MTIIAVRPEDRLEAQSPLERKKARVRPLASWSQEGFEAIAASSVAYLERLARDARKK